MLLVALMASSSVAVDGVEVEPRRSVGPRARAAAAPPGQGRVARASRASALLGARKGARAEHFQPVRLGASAALHFRRLVLVHLWL